MFWSVFIQAIIGAQVLFLRGTKILMEQEKFYSVAKKSSQRFSKFILKELFPKLGQILLPLSFIDLVF